MKIWDQSLLELSPQYLFMILQKLVKLFILELFLTFPKVLLLEIMHRFIPTATLVKLQQLVKILF